MTTDRLYTVLETSAMLNVSTATVRRWSGVFGEHLSSHATPPPKAERHYTEDDIRVMAYAKKRLDFGISIRAVVLEIPTATLPSWSDVQRNAVMNQVTTDVIERESHDAALAAVLAAQHSALNRLADGIANLADVGTLMARLDVLENRIDALERMVDALTRESHHHADGFPWRAQPTTW